MKRIVFGVLALASILLIGCKTQESAYRKAYEKAQAQQAQDAQNNPTVPVVTIETPVNPVDEFENLNNNDNNNLNANNNNLNNNDNNYNSYTYNSNNNNNNVDEYSLDNVKRYCVVVGSFESISGAEQRLQQAKNEGYGSAKIIRGGLGYRVVAASYNDIQSAKNSRKALLSKYGWAEGAWIFDKYQ